MREVKLLTAADIDAYTTIAYDAYPSFKDLSAEGLMAYKANLRDVIENDPDVRVFGLFEGVALIAVMRVFIFKMNYLGKMITASGLGFLGVHLLHKKKGAARELIDFYEKFSVEQGALIGLLLPFRPDYYKKFGYGFGGKRYQYRVKTSQLPAFAAAGGSLRYLSSSELQLLYDCHERVVKQTHGMLMKIGDERKNLEACEKCKIVASFDQNGAMDGYLMFEFENGKAGNYTINHLAVNELECETPAAFRRLAEFLRRQQDQVKLVIFNSGEDHLHYLFDNPLDDSENYAAFGNLQTNTQFVGVMYKVFQAAPFIAAHYRPVNPVPLAAAFEVIDQAGRDGTTAEKFTLSLLDGTVDDTLNHQAGKLPGVSVKISRADFSSLIMGCASPAGLFRMGRLELDNAGLLPELNRAFCCMPGPVCNTDF